MLLGILAIGYRRREFRKIRKAPESGLGKSRTARGRIP
jgi:hypothetical protein